MTGENRHQTAITPVLIITAVIILVLGVIGYSILAGSVTATGSTQAFIESGGFQWSPVLVAFLVVGLATTTVWSWQYSGGGAS